MEKGSHTQVAFESLLNMTGSVDDTIASRP
jgi:hypothetical protein